MNQTDLSAAQAALKEYFGYDGFRGGQEELIEGILSGRDVFGVMPTGAGKSICYQVPALLMRGITLVVSPLISLMKDQVGALVQAGVKAAFLNSSLTARQYRMALERAAAGAYKIIYVAPERLLTEEFQQLVAGLKIAMVSVDEAHCVSQWGQDFRPGYLDISAFVEGLPYRPVLSAFTATATAQVRADVVKLLNLRDPVLISTGFDRENLTFSVDRPRDKYASLLRFLREEPDRSGIIYCATRKKVEEVCDNLNRDGFSVTRYHAGLGETERRLNQDEFIYDRAQIMVATNAFGMGIDKSNVRFVVHYNMPKNMEGYYQEAGRAGRDGEPASCLLLYSGQDVITNRFLIERSNEQQEELDGQMREVLLEREHDRLRAMTFYCTTNDCLRAYILRYFGENAPSYCGNCGNCLHTFEQADISQDAHKILLCVRLTGERYGTSFLAAILHGGSAQQDERIERAGFGRLAVYGTLSALPLATIVEEIRFLEQQGYLASSGGEYPVMGLTERSNAVFDGETQIFMRRAQPQEKKKKVGKGRTRQVEHPELFERLKTLRRTLSAKLGVPPYVVFTDAALHGMCSTLPCTNEEFLEVPGVGQTKLQRFGAEFLREIAQFRLEQE